MASLEDRKLRSLDWISQDHLRCPYENEIFSDARNAKERIQNYAFTQGFEVVTHNRDKVRQILALDCTQHGTNTKNWCKTPIDKMKRINTKLSAKKCLFRLRIT